MQHTHLIFLFIGTLALTCLSCHHREQTEIITIPVDTHPFNDNAEKFYYLYSQYRRSC